MNKRTLRLLLACLYCCFLVKAAHAQSPGQAVAPKQLFPSSLLNVYTPDSDEWIITGVTNNGISFGKRGAEGPALGPYLDRQY